MALLLAGASAHAEESGGKFSDILKEVGSYGRAISVARACGMARERADRALSMVMVYAYAAAKPQFTDANRKRMFLVKVVERVSRKHEVAAPGEAMCAHSFKVIEYLPKRLDEAVRRSG